MLWPRVDRYARISVGKCRYSVPARLIGSRVRVMLSANELRVFDGSRLAAVHPRLIAAGDEHLELDHYLEILVRKPGALPGSAVLAQARAAGVFTSAHEAFWAAARARHGDGAGTRALIEVLLLHRRMPASQVIAGMTAALAAGSCSPERRRGRGPQARRPATRDHPARLVVTWLADGGLRIGELCGLHLADLHLREQAACGQCRAPHVHVCHRPGNPNGAEAKTKLPWRLEGATVTGGLIKRVSPAMVHAYCRLHDR